MSKVVTRRERREQMRRERPQRPHGPAPRRRRIGGPWVPIGVVAVLAAVGFALYQTGALAPGARPADIRDAKYEVTGEVIGTKQADEGTSHVTQGQKVQYGTNPPTSGGHWGAPAGPVAWGIKDTTFPDEAVVHNLEHGGILIVYKGLTEEETAKLKDIVRTLMNNGYPKIVLQPYPQLTEARVAVSAWNWLLKLPGSDDVQVVKFVKAHYDGPDAPERGVR